jgi:DNA-binding transcriptional ArsR family regulator
MGDVTFGAVSQHLAVLAGAGLVEARTEGRSRLYRARPAALGPLKKWLETTWDDALYRLKIAAEMEQARRGPRARRRKTR